MTMTDMKMINVMMICHLLLHMMIFHRLMILKKEGKILTVCTAILQSQNHIVTREPNPHSHEDVINHAHTVLVV